MPALDNLPLAPEDHAEQYWAHLERCSQIAERIPLVRVIVPTNDRGPLEVHDIFSDGVLRRSHKSDHSRLLEQELGAGDGLYFHAGRTHPQYGRAVFVIADSPVHAEVTPFGLGGLCCPNNNSSPLHADGSCISPVAHLERSIQRGFVLGSTWRDDWRARVGQYLAWYFGSTPSRYFLDGSASRPSRPDPEGIFIEPRNRDWRIWTAEVRILDDLLIRAIIDQGALLFWGVHSSVEQELKRNAYTRRMSMQTLYPIWIMLPRDLRVPVERVPGTDRFGAVDRAILGYVL
jgi:hypothetical protein